MFTPSFLGYLLISYSPFMTILILCIARNPRYSFLCILGTFSWLINTLISSILWYFIHQKVQNRISYAILLGVTFQELGRCAFCFLYSFVQDFLLKLVPTSHLPYAHLQYGFAIGLGYGFMSSFIFSINALTNTYGPGTYYVPSCSYMPFFLITGKNKT
jgi:anterior pharynx defective protein 1